MMSDDFTSYRKYSNTLFTPKIFSIVGVFFAKQTAMSTQICKKKKIKNWKPNVQFKTFFSELKWR